MDQGKGMCFPQWLTKCQLRVKLPLQAIIAEVAEQADALRSGRSGLYAHVGSTPTFGTEEKRGNGFRPGNRFVLF